MRLLNRTNRSVTLTSAGEELQASLTDPFAAISEAAEQLNRFRDAPTGRIRLNAPSDAASLLLGPVLPIFPGRVGAQHGCCGAPFESLSSGAMANHRVTGAHHPKPSDRLRAVRLFRWRRPRVLKPLPAIALALANTNPESIAH